MAHDSQFGNLNLIAVKTVDGDAAAVKAQEINQVTHFVDSVDETPKVVIDVKDRHCLITSNGRSYPVSIGVPTNKGTRYGYRQNGYYIDVVLKKMVGTLTYTKEVQP